MRILGPPDGEMRMRCAFIEFPEDVYLREAKLHSLYAYDHTRYLPFLVANQGANIERLLFHPKRKWFHLSVTTNLVGEVVSDKISPFRRRFSLSPHRTYYLSHIDMTVSSRRF